MTDWNCSSKKAGKRGVGTTGVFMVKHEKIGVLVNYPGNVENALEGNLTEIECPTTYVHAGIALEEWQYHWGQLHPW